MLPLSFIWGWAACTLLCGEITARQEKLLISHFEQKSGNCLVGFEVDDCPYLANVAVIEARQNLATPLSLIPKTISLPSTEFSFFSVSVYPTDRKQNSPPRNSSAPPLFLRLRTFRI